MTAVFWILRIVAVIALLGCAAVLTTPKGRLPLALRGVRKILRKDLGAANGPVEDVPVSGGRKALAFLLVLLAVAVCCAG